jgi:hypothetical protein
MRRAGGSAVLDANRTDRSGLPGRARATLVWGTTAFVVVQLTLWLVLNTSWRARDPEYGLRLQNLRTRMAERPAQRPLVVFLGSSRVATGVRPDLLPANRIAGGSGPLAFNCALCRSGPLLELLCLRRLLADGIRPDCVFIEAWWYTAAADADGQMAVIQPERLRSQDLRTLRAYHQDSRPAYRRWADEAVPCLSYRTHLLNQVAPSWVGRDRQAFNGDWEGLDGWGWLRHPSYVKRWSLVADRVREEYLPAAWRFAPSDESRRAFAELLALCRREKIAAVLLAMPDAWLADYEPAVRARMDGFLHDLSREHDTPLIDTRDWMPRDAFADDVHLTHDGAAAFTERLGREVRKALPWEL